MSRTPVRVIRRIVSALYELRLLVRWTAPAAVAYTRYLGVQVASDARIFRGVGFGSEPWLVCIGRKTWVTAGVQFITHDGSITVVQNGGFTARRDHGINRYGRICVGDNCFIGLRAMILPGVHIGDNSIVAAGPS